MYSSHTLPNRTIIEPHGLISHSVYKPMAEILQKNKLLYMKSDYPTRYKFGWAVVACAHVWPNLNIRMQMRENRKFHRLSVVSSKYNGWTGPWCMRYRCDGGIYSSSASLLRHGSQYGTLFYLHIADLPATAKVITSLILEDMGYMLITAYRRRLLWAWTHRGLVTP